MLSGGAFSNIIPDIFSTFSARLWLDFMKWHIWTRSRHCRSSELSYLTWCISFLFPPPSRLSILLWFMWLFAAVETQIHKLLVPRHWLGSFAQECCLWPPVQASRLYCRILHLNSQGKGGGGGEKLESQSRNNRSWFYFHNYPCNCKYLRWLNWVALLIFYTLGFKTQADVCGERGGMKCNLI